MLSRLPPLDPAPIRLFRPRVRPGKTAAEFARRGREINAPSPNSARSDAAPPPVTAAAEAECRPPEPLEMQAMTRATG